VIRHRLFCESYRDEYGRPQKWTLANLSKLPDHLIATAPQQNPPKKEHVSLQLSGSKCVKLAVTSVGHRRWLHVGHDRS
jgi:hypothetical protein